MDSNAVRIYRALRDRIASGALPPGARLRQEALAAEFDVSRTPLREALRWLAGEGLVELEPRRGARVAAVPLEDMREAYEARLVLEPAAARLAACAALPGPLHRMREAVEDHRRVRRGDVAASFAANRAFHLALVAGAGNDHLLRLAEDLWLPRLGGAVYAEQRESAAEVRRDIEEHEAIAAAVAAGDEDAAGARTERHVQRAMAGFLARVEGGVSARR